MLVTRGTTTQQSECLITSIPELMPGSRRDCNGVSRSDFAQLAINLNPARPVRDEIDFLGPLMVVLLGGASNI